ncbi:replication protein, partial [Salmonella enterica subsp. enterica serovar Kentucky]
MLSPPRSYPPRPRTVAAAPAARGRCLPLTVRHCAIAERGEMLNRMNAAFQRMKVRKEYLPVQGWI